MTTAATIDKVIHAASPGLYKAAHDTYNSATSLVTYCFDNAVSSFIAIAGDVMQDTFGA